MLQEFFILGGIPFCLLMAVETILLLCWVEYECPGWATTSVLLVLGFLQLCGYQIVQSAFVNPLITLYVILAYFGAGTFWAICRWWFFVKDQREKYDVFKADWLHRHDVMDGIVPDSMKAEFAHDATHFSYYDANKFELKPQVSNHKGRIYIWMAYWPASMLWTLINDPVKKTFRWIYTQIRGFLQRISDHVWAGVDQDLEVKKGKEK